MNKNSKKIKKIKKSAQEIESVQNLFAQKIQPVQHQEEENEAENEQKFQLKNKENQEIEQKNPIIDENESMAANQERLERAIFIGNVSLAIKKSEIYQIFKKYGKIEKIWTRSVPVQKTKGLTKKAQVILKKYKESASQTCNYYILFENKIDAKNALNENGKGLGGLHIRVDSAKEPEKDYITTIFIGNLPFRAKEEEIRNHFSACGEIENIRVIRDENFKGKGFAYVKFATTDGYKNGIAMNNSEFQTRQLRIKKAVPIERLQKKQNNAEKRIKNKNKKQLNQKQLKQQQRREGGISMKSLKAFANKDIDAQPEFIHQNQLTVPPRVQRKKIKKLGKNVSSEKKFHELQKQKKQFDQKNDSNIFNNTHELKKRKEVRSKKKLNNMAKAKLAYKPQKKGKVSQ